MMMTIAEKQMATVLLVVSDYLTAHSVGAERVRKFAKYLPEFGFNVCVLTSTKPDHLSSEGTKIYWAFEPGHFYRPFFRRCFHKSSPSVPGKQATIVPRFESGLDKTPLRGVRSWMLDNVLMPDLGITLFPGAIWTGRKAVRKENIDIILSSGPPHSVHLAAGCLATLTNRPWVADFRDGWLFESLNPLLRTDNWRSRIEKRMERWVSHRANAVISVSQPICNYFEQAYSLPPTKNHVITNGFDPTDWCNIRPIPQDTDKFRLVYTGSFSLSRMTQSPEPVLAALQTLHPEVRTHLCLVLVGALTDTERSAIQKYGLSDVVKEIGLVSHSESLAYQLSADCLLLMVGSDRSVATSKLYEYLYSRRPILAISAEDTAAADIVRKTESGKVVAPDNPQAIAASLTDLYTLWKKGELICRSVGIERYKRRELTRQLVDICGELLSRKIKRYHKS